MILLDTNLYVILMFQMTSNGLCMEYGQQQNTKRVLFSAGK